MQPVFSTIDMPPEPPRKIVAGRLSVTEINQSAGPHTVPPSATDSATTARPPPPDRRPIPIEFRRPAKVPPEAGRDSLEVPIETLLAEITAKDARARKAEAELAAARAEIEAAKRATVVVGSGPTEKQLRKAALHSAVLKVLAGLAAALGAVTTYLAVHSATVIPPRVESAEVRTKVVEDASDVDHAALLALREYLRAYQAYQACINGQIRSAMRRGTGQLLIAIPETSVEWSSQNMPPSRAPVLWQSWTWATITQCPPPPAPP